MSTISYPDAIYLSRPLSQRCRYKTDIRFQPLATAVPSEASDHRPPTSGLHPSLCSSLYAHCPSPAHWPPRASVDTRRVLDWAWFSHGAPSLCPRRSVVLPSAHSSLTACNLPAIVYNCLQSASASRRPYDNPRRVSIVLASPASRTHRPYSRLFSSVKHLSLETVSPCFPAASPAHSQPHLFTADRPSLVPSTLFPALRLCYDTSRSKSPPFHRSSYKVKSHSKQ